MEEKYSDYKKMSKQDWGEYHPNANGLPPDVKFWPGHQAMQTGCMQRIADATEAMAKGYVHLQNDRDWYKKMHAESLEKRTKLERSITAYKSNMTRKINRIKELEIELRAAKRKLRPPF